MLIHGGPQGAWGQSWSYRWNAQVFAAAGYVVVMPNPRGSTGYGQKFIDEINGDWGGRAFDDIMAVADYIVANFPMPTAPDGRGRRVLRRLYGRLDPGPHAAFKALVSHAGVYDLRSMFGATEELWFPLWEFGGTAVGQAGGVCAIGRPATSRRNSRRPTLVIHGEMDFRVPYDAGAQLFTALQLQKVPSKLLLYPDEGHWILKPQNQLWYKTVIDWIDSWLKK